MQSFPESIDLSFKNQFSILSVFAFKMPLSSKLLMYSLLITIDNDVLLLEITQRVNSHLQDSRYDTVHTWEEF